MLYLLKKDKSGKPDLEYANIASLSEAHWSELDLENILAERIQDVLREDKLMVITQERPAQEEADILALDETGILFIFELKKYPSQGENLLQVIRYGQKFGQYKYEDLNNIWKSYSKDTKIPLDETHKNYFDLDNTLPHHEFNKNQQFVVITAGADMETLSSIEYWKNKHLPITALTYHVYRLNNDFLLEFHGFSPDPEDYSVLLSPCYIVNTDYTWDQNAYKEMLKGRASAYWGRKTAVDRIQKGNRVYLYHTGVGIIASGRALSSVKKDKCDGADDEEHYIPVNWQYKIAPYKQPNFCVTANEINQHFGTGQRFRLTCFSISREWADFIDSKLLEKQPKEDK